LTNQFNIFIVPFMLRAGVAIVLECYPRIFLACHRRHVRDESSGRTISAHQAGVLDHLDAIEPTHLRELAAHLGVTPSTMSLTVDRLERGGYVRRWRDRADARCVNLTLTRAGARIKQKQKALDENLVEAMLRRVPPRERPAALAGLQTLARAAGEMTALGQDAAGDRAGRRGRVI